MTLIVVPSSGPGSYDLRTGDILHVPTGVTLWNSSLTPIVNWFDFGLNVYEPGATVSVDGTVIFDATPVLLYSDGAGLGDHAVSVGETGIVRGGPISPAIYMEGYANTLSNAGQISGNAGVSASAWTWGYIQNTGSILGHGGWGVGIFDLSDVDIVNTGTIGGATGIVLNQSTARIVNSGTIFATASVESAVSAVFGTGLVLRNSGLIEGTAYAVIGSFAANDRVINTGVIDGDVDLGGGTDIFRGRHGELHGDLIGGGGGDELGGGTTDDRIFGGKLDDWICGHGGDDILTGNTGADVFAFRRGGDDDIVTDFVNGADGLDLAVFRFATFAAVSALASDRTGGMLLDLRSLGGGTAFLEGFAKAQFDAGDVIL